MGGKVEQKKGRRRSFCERASEWRQQLFEVVLGRIPSTALLRDAPRFASCSTGRAAALSGGKRADTSMGFLSRARNRLPCCDLYRPAEEQPGWTRGEKNKRNGLFFPTSALSWQDVLTSCCVFNCVFYFSSFFIESPVLRKIQLHRSFFF